MQQSFLQHFGEEATYHIFSPYRVCPLGAHVDHQHGLVTGFAFDMGVDLLFNVTDDGSVSLRSLTFEGDIDFDITRPTQVKEGNWGDYARGAKFALKKRFVLTKGIKGVIKGSLPIGGLSSSAAVLIAYVMAFAKANNITLTPMEVIKIASQAEREYIGLSNGILDQACIALSEKDALLFLDTDTEQYRIIRRNPRMPEFELAIIFSGLTRSLVNSDYNLRVAECKTSAWNMMAYTGMPLKSLDKTFLRDVPKETYDLTKEKNNRVLNMEEKPQVPKSRWAVPPFYIYRKEDLDLVRHSVENGCSKDAPGNLAHYMVEKTTMHAWPMSAGRFDIGSLDTYKEACERFGGGQE